MYGKTFKIIFGRAAAPQQQPIWAEKDTNNALVRYTYQEVCNYLHYECLLFFCTVACENMGSVSRTSLPGLGVVGL